MANIQTNFELTSLFSIIDVFPDDIDTMRWFTDSEFQTLYAVGGNYRCQDAKEEWL